MKSWITKWIILHCSITAQAILGYINSCELANIIIKYKNNNNNERNKMIYIYIANLHG